MGPVSSGPTEVSVELRPSSLGVSGASVSFVLEVGRLVSLWRMPGRAQGTQGRDRRC